MKKGYIAVGLCILMLASIPLSTVQANDEVVAQSLDSEPESLFGVTFIAGLIMNPQESGKYVEAKALILAYYDRGIIIKDSGIAFGLKDVKFKPGDFLYMSEPVQFGIVQVAGMCTGFSIQN